MMFFRLAGAFLSDFLRFPAFRKGGSAPSREWLFRLLALFVLVIALVLAWFLLDAFYSAVIKTGFFLRRPETVFFTAALLSWLALFFVGLSTARALFSNQKENELLRTLPFGPFPLTLARFAALYALLLPLELFLFLPALFVYIRFMSPDLRALGGIAVNVLLVPLPPAALALALVTALRRLPRWSRWSAPVEIAGLLFIVLLLAFLETALQHALFSATRSAELIFPVELAIFLGRLMEALPPAAWAAAAFRPGEEVLSALLCLGFALVCTAPALWWATRSWAAGPVRERPRVFKTAPSPEFRGGTLAALVLREAKTFLSESGLLGLAALRLLILPVFLLLFVAAGPPELSGVLVSFVSSSPWIALGAVGLLLFLIDISFLAATAVSREGGQLGLSLTLPVDGALQLKAKALFLLALSLPPAGLSLALVYALFPIALETLVCAVPGVAAYAVFSVTVGLFLDVRRPAAARTRSLSGWLVKPLLAMAVEFAALALLGAAAGASFLAGLSPLAAGFLVVTILTAADILLWPRLLRYASRRYAFELEG